MGAFVVPVKGLIYSIYQDLGAEKGVFGLSRRVIRRNELIKKYPDKQTFFQGI
jgi:hypothetical protein